MPSFGPDRRAGDAQASAGSTQPAKPWPSQPSAAAGDAHADGLQERRRLTSRSGRRRRASNSCAVMRGRHLRGEHVERSACRAWRPSGHVESARASVIVSRFVGAAPLVALGWRALGLVRDDSARGAGRQRVMPK